MTPGFRIFCPVQKGGGPKNRNPGLLLTRLTLAIGIIPTKDYVFYAIPQLIKEDILDTEDPAC
jgi:hypothetical protein